MTPASTPLSIEVVYAPQGANTVWRRLLTAQTPYTVGQALAESTILLQFPEINLVKSHRIGIFGKMVSHNTLLKNQDRLEIYRPLAQDPKILRIKRAQDQRNHGK